MQATENLDAVYLATLLGELGQISNIFERSTRRRVLDAQAADLIEAKTRLDQLRVRISKDVLDMGKQEAADDSEMPLGTIAARAHRIEDEVAY